MLAYLTGVKVKHKLSQSMLSEELCHSTLLMDQPY